LEDVTKILELVQELKNNIGIWAAILGLILIIGILLLWQFTIRRLQATANHSFNEKLEKLKNNLNEQLNLNLIEKSKVVTTELEKIKASLQINNSTKINLIQEEKKSIINFNQSFYLWKSNLTSIPDQLFTKEQCDIELKNLNELYQNVSTNFAYLQLFLRDKELLQKCNNVIVEHYRNLPKLKLEYISMIQFYLIEKQFERMNTFEFASKCLELSTSLSENIEKFILKTNEMSNSLIIEFRKHLGVDNINTTPNTAL